MDLFGEAVAGALERSGPLAARMRPARLEEVVGQEALLGQGSWLAEAMRADRVPSLVLYGPPGSGKTTLARLVASTSAAEFVELSAVSATLSDVRSVLAQARDRLAAGRSTVLFLDEIHRFNKAQQDALLPAVEDGLVTLIGATTENPYYEVNSALISRMRVIVLEPLADTAIADLVRRAASDPRGLAGRVAVPEEGVAAIVSRAGGDARAALNLLEAAAAGLADGATLDAERVSAASGARQVAYDKNGDAHYDYASAFIKSLRASDPDAAVYYLAVMLAGGEDPRFIARRLVVAASEDVGNADPTALQVAVAAAHAVDFVGLPEARINLAQATVYLALAPKSNASYRALGEASAEIEREGARRPPLALRDGSRPNARFLGHGEGYRYPHDHPEGVLDESLLPEELEGRRFYRPTTRGPEGELSERLRRLRGGGPDEDDSERPF